MEVGLPLWFQFLLGRLKTVDTAVKAFFTNPFQFLLGRLKTFLIVDGLNLFARVSIPLRQAKNCPDQETVLCILQFQFLLGRLKTGKQCLE